MDWETLNQKIIACVACPRLAAWRAEVARTRRRAYQNWNYWGKPVTGFGDRQAPLLIVGLAPGAHGANRTGRVFTGDDAGNFLFAALHRAGFANQPTSIQTGDGLKLTGAYITAVCRCVPPDNKPLPVEVAACLPYLTAEINLLQSLRVIVALGKIAFDTILHWRRRQGHPNLSGQFAHGALFELGPGLPVLLASYHPSRQNTQTGRLTAVMFDQIWQQARALLPPGSD
jgi:uracil-DNA glycosylase family 4